jgi:hypothetical protein
MTDATEKGSSNAAAVDAIDAVARVLFRAHDDAVCEGREPKHDFDVMAQSDYNGWSVIEGWRAAARAAIELGARAGDPVVEAWRVAYRESRRFRLRDLVDPGSTNFLGTGLSLREFMELHSAEKLSLSWSLQPREEQKRRLSAIVRLSAELERIREKEIFATGLAEMAIEAVIEGDWKMVEEWAEHFAFEDERDKIHIHGAAIYGTFRELLLQALRTGKEGPA